MQERDLKHWIGNNYDVQFIEPSFGGSIGLPDVEAKLSNGKSLPIELKVGSFLKSGALSIKIRPSQYRYHILEAERGAPTAVMVAVGCKTKFDVYLFAGRYVEGDAYKKYKPLLIARSARYTDNFWEANLRSAFEQVRYSYAVTNS